MPLDLYENHKENKWNINVEKAIQARDNLIEQRTTFTRNLGADAFSLIFSIIATVLLINQVFPDKTHIWLQVTTFSLAISAIFFRILSQYCGFMHIDSNLKQIFKEEIDHIVLWSETKCGRWNYYLYKTFIFSTVLSLLFAGALILEAVICSI